MTFNFFFWTKFRFLTKISIFDQNFDFWPKFRFLTKISIFDQNFDFRSKKNFFLNKISTFNFLAIFLHQYWTFWHFEKYQVLPKICELTALANSVTRSRKSSSIYNTQKMWSKFNLDTRLYDTFTFWQIV